MDFEWDEAKASTNQRKHGISFVEASEVFNDDFSSCIPDPDHAYEEHRYLLFGVSSKATPLVVSFTERGDAIRIISSRRMTALIIVQPKSSNRAFAALCCKPMCRKVCTR